MVILARSLGEYTDSHTKIGNATAGDVLVLCPDEKVGLAEVLVYGFLDGFTPQIPCSMAGRDPNGFIEALEYGGEELGYVVENSGGLITLRPGEKDPIVGSYEFNGKHDPRRLQSGLLTSLLSPSMKELQLDIGSNPGDERVRGVAVSYLLQGGEIQITYTLKSGVGRVPSSRIDRFTRTIADAVRWGQQKNRFELGVSQERNTGTIQRIRPVLGL